MTTSRSRAARIALSRHAEWAGWVHVYEGHVMTRIYGSLICLALACGCNVDDGATEGKDTSTGSTSGSGAASGVCGSTASGGASSSGGATSDTGGAPASGGTT